MTAQPERSIPSAGEAITVDGIKGKHRVREYTGGELVIAPAGPNWRTARTRTVTVSATNWDAEAGMWRAQA